MPHHGCITGLQIEPIPGNLNSGFARTLSFFLSIVNSPLVSLSENRHFKHKKLDFFTDLFSFSGVWQKISIEDDILVAESFISTFNSANIAETLSFFLSY